MKVLVLSSMYPNSKVYLSGVFVHEQVKELLKLNVKVDVIAPIPYSPPLLQKLKKKWSSLKQVPEVEEIENVRIFHPRYLAIPSGIFKGYWSYIYSLNTLRILKKYNLNDYDLVHAHGGLPDDFAGCLISRKLKLPYVLTVHGAAVYATIKNKSHFNKSQKSIECADAVVGVSSKVTERVKKYSNRISKCYTIHNGFKPSEKSILESAYSSEKLTIMFGASLVERKGCEYLLRAFQKLKEKFPNINLVVAGGGELLEPLRELSQDLGINEVVEFKGRVSHAEMLNLMNKCSIFVLPSWDEAFGVVYLESMSLGKPVIATFNEGITDIIVDGENGFLVKKKDVGSLVQKLTMLIENKELRKTIGLNGYKSVKNLTWRNNATQYLDLYKKIAEDTTEK